MSLSLARLQRLKAQAGGPAQVAAPVAAANNETSVEMLRRLLRVRPATPTVRAGAAERELPGVEIAPAVRFVQRTLPNEDMPALIAVMPSTRSGCFSSTPKPPAWPAAPAPVLS
jgi:hypothetical protein